MTSAWKYYLRGLLMIPMVDEEVCSRDDSGFEPSTAKASDAQIAKVQALIEGAADPKEALGKTLKWAGVADLSQMTAEKADGIIKVKA